MLLLKFSLMGIGRISFILGYNTDIFGQKKSSAKLHLLLKLLSKQKYSQLQCQSAALEQSDLKHSFR